MELDEELPTDHRTRFLDRFVDELDLTVLEELYRGSGSAPYEPAVLLKLALYAWLDGRGSPASWSKLAKENVAVRWLLRGIRPSRSCCYNFRDRVGHALPTIHADVVRMAIQEGLVDPEEGFLDGTSTRAAASRHRVVNQKTLERRRQVLAQAIQNDQEDKPLEAVPQWMARTRKGRISQQKRFDQAAEEMARRQLENAKRTKDRRLAEDKMQVSLSEPEAPLGRDKEKVFCALYTSQYVVEPSSLLILAYDVFAQVTDAGCLPIMLDKTVLVIGHSLDTVVADGGYVSLLDIQACEQRGTELIAGPIKDEEQKSQKSKKSEASKKKSPKLDKREFTFIPEEQLYRCPEGHKLELRQKARVERRGGETLVELRFQCSPEHCVGCRRQPHCVDNPHRGRLIKRLEGEELLDAHREKMKTDRAKKIYRTRGQVIERAFADTKQHRQGRRFHGRGLHRAKAEVGLLVLAQNFLAILRLRKKRENEVAAET
jgi:transposase